LTRDSLWLTVAQVVELDDRLQMYVGRIKEAEKDVFKLERQLEAGSCFFPSQLQHQHVTKIALKSSAHRCPCRARLKRNLQSPSRQVPERRNTRRGSTAGCRSPRDRSGCSSRSSRRPRAKESSSDTATLSCPFSGACIVGIVCTACVGCTTTQSVAKVCRGSLYIQ
jgi:hypothetical protein